MLLRVFAVIIVLAFLGLIAKVAMIAFGSGERRAQQVERSLHPAPAPSQ